MTSLADHPTSDIVKALYIGDPTTGKTGSLVSLVADGYKLRILDFDNKVSVLKQFIQKQCPDKLANVDVETRRDLFKATNSGPVIKGQPKAFVQGLELMTKWSDGSDPSEWGADTVFVLDSLSNFGRAAFEWARGMNPGAKDPRQWYFAAQQALESTVALLTSESFNANVIVISHISWREMQDGTTKGYANAIGSALGPLLARYFNMLILAESSGSGKNVKRKIKTAPTGSIDLMTPAPFKIEGELPLETGLSTIFKALKEK